MKLDMLWAALSGEGWRGAASASFWEEEALVGARSALSKMIHSQVITTISHRKVEISKTIYLNVDFSSKRINAASEKRVSLLLEKEQKCFIVEAGKWNHF